MSSWSGRKVAKLKRLVAATYGLTCHICHGPIDPQLQHPHRQALTVDHVVPRSRGGSDAIENLRPAHYTCNSSRQARYLQLGQPVDNRAWFAS